MKNMIRILIAVLLSSAGCTQNKSEGYSIRGTIKGVDSGMVKLVRYTENRTTKTLDSVAIKNGKFEFKGNLDVPEMMGLSILPGNMSFRFFLENAAIAIAVDTAGAEHYDYTAYGMDKGAVLKKTEVSGSASQAAFDQFQRDPEQIKFKAVFAGLNKAYEAEKNASGKEKIRTKFDSVGNLSKAWQIKWIRDYVSKNPESTTGVYIFNDYYTLNSSMPLAAMDSLLGKFSGEAKKSVYYADLIGQAKLRRALLPGKLAPDFTLLKRDSSSFTLSSTRGKYIMIDFWASWCKPCREAIPHWKEVYAKYKDKGFDIVSVSDDSKWSDWIKAMDMEKMPWNQVIDEFPVKHMPAKIGSLYQTHFIPFYVLLDKQGKILVYSGEEKEINAKLTEIFK